jgi:hypothetical protein
MAAGAQVSLQVTGLARPCRLTHPVLGQHLFEYARRLPYKQGDVGEDLDNHSRDQDTSNKVYMGQDANVLNDWYNEWSTAPNDPLPSNLRPLLRLREPIWSGQNCPPTRQENVMLDHYYPDMVPEARAQQDMKREREERRYLEDHAEETVWKAERALERQEVVKAAQLSDVIDLTGDYTAEGRVLYSISGNYCMPRPRQRYANVKDASALSAWAKEANHHQHQDPRRHQQVDVDRLYHFPNSTHDNKQLHSGQAAQEYGRLASQQPLHSQKYDDAMIRPLAMYTHTQPHPFA